VLGVAVGVVARRVVRRRVFVAAGVERVRLPGARPRRKFSDRFDTIRISQPAKASGFCSVSSDLYALRNASCTTSSASSVDPSSRYATATAGRW
jgi:hypothetical protein